VVKFSEKCLYACVAMGLVYLCAFLYVAAGRTFFPFEIEWMEGGMVTHAARLVLGLPIYAEPSADFVPFFYTPGYPALVAFLGRIFGDVSLPLARCVSLFACLGTFGTLFYIVRRESSTTYALLGLGIYAALFRTNGAFYDLARPDSLYLFLVFLGVVLVYRARGHGALVLAGLIFVCAFFTKQTSSVFVPPLIMYLIWRDWRQAVTFSVVTFGVATLGVWWVDYATDGWFWTFIFEGHQGHTFYWKNILMEYWRDVLFLAPALLLIPLLWFGYRVPVLGLSVLLIAHWSYAFYFRTQTLDYVPHMYYRELFYENPRWLLLVPPALIAGLCVWYRASTQVSGELKTKAFWLLMFVAGVGASAMNHSTQWAYSNCFMPISLFGAVLIPLAIRDLLEQEEARFAWVLPVALMVQFVAWGYSPSAQVPDDADEAALSMLERRMEAIDGKILFPAHPMSSYLRDGEVHIHQMGIQDVGFMGGVKDLPRRLRAREWAAVIQDERTRIPGLASNYYVGETLRYESKDALRAKTGFLVRPMTIWFAQSNTARALITGVTGNFEREARDGWTGDVEAFVEPKRRSRTPGRQGDQVLTSRRGEVGVLKTASFTLEKPRLTYLLAAKGKRGGGLRVVADGQTLVTRRPPPRARLRLRRGEIDLSAHLGKRVHLEVFDDDPAGGVYVDDLRFTSK